MSGRTSLLSRLLVVLLALCALAGAARAQDIAGPLPPDMSASRSIVPPSDIGPPEVPGRLNPLRVLAGAGDALAESRGGREAEEAGGLSVALNVMLVLTVIALAPSIMLMCTCFVRVLIVLGLVRQAMGVHSVPPAQVLTALALFMTAMVMTPTVDRIWTEAVIPYRAGEINDYDTLWERGSRPLRDFMLDQIEATDGWSSLYAVMQYRGRDLSDPGSLTREDVEMSELVPAYMLNELKVAFLMGFRVYLPFLVIDMVIATILISMSMMMLPPVIISLPFKLLLFVMVDGWTLLVGSLLESFVLEGQIERLSAEPAAAVVLLCLLRPRPGGSGSRDPAARQEPLLCVRARGGRR